MAREHAAVVATGRSRLPEPDQQRAGLPRRVPRACSTRRRTRIDDTLLVAAAEAIAGVVTDDELNANYIIPSVFHADVHDAVADAPYRGRRARPYAARVPHVADA